MATQSVKRNLVPLYILAVLLEHGVNRGLTKEQIDEYLREDHGIALERHALVRNLSELKQFCDSGALPELTIERSRGKRGRTYWELVHESEFDPSQVRFLMDSLIAFPAVTDSHRSELVNKLGHLSMGQGELPRNIQPMDTLVPNKQLFSTIDQLALAIREDRGVSFYLNEYGPDMKLHPGRRHHHVRPFQLLMQDGRYYLLARYRNPKAGRAEKNYHFRVDLITDVTVEEKVDPKDKALWPKDLLGNGFNVATYRARHPILWSDELEAITFRIREEHCTWAVDRFGGNVSFDEPHEGWVEAHVFSSPTAMVQWAIAHPQDIEVLEPAHVRQTLREKANELREVYAQ